MKKKKKKLSQNTNYKIWMADYLYPGTMSMTIIKLSVYSVSHIVFTDRNVPTPPVSVTDILILCGLNHSHLNKSWIYILIWMKEMWFRVLFVHRYWDGNFKTIFYRHFLYFLETVIIYFQCRSWLSSMMLRNQPRFSQRSFKCFRAWCVIFFHVFRYLIMFRSLFFLFWYDAENIDSNIQLKIFFCEIYIQYTYIVGKYIIYLYEL